MGGRLLPHLPHLPLLPSPFLGEGLGVRALALEYLSDIFCFDEKPVPVSSPALGKGLGVMAYFSIDLGLLY